MPTTMTAHLVGVFAERVQSESAVEELRHAGFPPDHIGVVVRGSGGTGDRPVVNADVRPEEGAATGAVAGGAAAGAVTGGLVGTLIGLGIPEDEAHTYQADIESGRTLVTVKADGRYNEAIQILRSHGALGKGKPLL